MPRSVPLAAGGSGGGMVVRGGRIDDNPRNHPAQRRPDSVRNLRRIRDRQADDVPAAFESGLGRAGPTVMTRTVAGTLAHFATAATALGDRSSTAATLPEDRAPAEAGRSVTGVVS